MAGNKILLQNFHVSHPIVVENVDMPESLEVTYKSLKVLAPYLESWLRPTETSQPHPSAGDLLQESDDFFRRCP
jgi:hypothetical protein